jgi:hypothetical protein
MPQHVLQRLREGICVHIRFQTPHQYFFIYENVKHLLLLWSKEQHRELYIVEEEGDVLNLRYPGETYRELVLEQLEDIFFQRLETEDDQFRAALAASFSHRDRLYGAYYPIRQGEAGPVEQLYFFEIRGQKIVEIPDDEYEDVAQTFFETFPEYIGR